MSAAATLHLFQAVCHIKHELYTSLFHQ